MSHSTILRSGIAVLMIGTISSSRSLGDDEAADMLGEMAGEAHDLVGLGDHMREVRIRLVESAGPGLTAR